MKNLDLIPIPDGNTLKMVRTHEIVRLEAKGNYTLIAYDSGKKVLASKNIGHFEPYLNVETFIRVHHSHIINVFYVDTLTLNRNAKLLMKDGMHVTISRRKKKEVINSLLSRS